MCLHLLPRLVSYNCFIELENEVLLPLSIFITLNLHPKITDKIERIYLWSKKAGSELFLIKEYTSSISLNRLPTCSNSYPNNRLTSSVRVIWLNSSLFFIENFKGKSMENLYFIGADISKRIGFLCDVGRKDCTWRGNSQRSKGSRGNWNKIITYRKLSNACLYRKYRAIHFPLWHI